MKSTYLILFAVGVGLSVFFADYNTFRLSLSLSFYSILMLAFHLEEVIKTKQQ